MRKMSLLGVGRLISVLFRRNAGPNTVSRKRPVNGAILLPRSRLGEHLGTPFALWLCVKEELKGAP